VKGKDESLQRVTRVWHLWLNAIATSTAKGDQTGKTAFGGKRVNMNLRHIDTSPTKHATTKQSHDAESGNRQATEGSVWLNWDGSCTWMMLFFIAYTIRSRIE